MHFFSMPQRSIAGAAINLELERKKNKQRFLTLVFFLKISLAFDELPLVAFAAVKAH